MSRKIKINNLNVSYGRKQVLKNINLEMTVNNNIVGLFGPNGAGKTTLIKTLTGFINKYDGIVNGANYKKIGYLPDCSFLYNFMTLDLAIKYFLDAFKEYDTDKAIRLFNQLHLNLNQKMSECSKGMLEQINIILVLCRNVDIYIFDEPLAAVDPLTRDNIMEIIKKERYRNSMVLISTHLINDVEELFDEVIMIKEGEIVLYDNVKDLKKSSNNNSLEEIFKEKLR